MDTETEKMMDVVFYREVVLEIILSGEHIAREVYELRFKLFLRAVDYYFSKNNREVLEPFPPCFFDCASKQRRYDDLKSCVSSFPQLSQIREDTSLPELVWELLHWIFTNPLIIQNADRTHELSGLFTDDLRELTQLRTIPRPSNSCQRFEITHPIEGANSTKVFLKHKGTYKSFYAYHGSPVRNYHSIIHRGLRCSLNYAYGKGVYLSSNLDTARSYASDYLALSQSNIKSTSSDDGIAYCIAIVEVIKHPSIKVVAIDGARNMTDDNKFDKTSTDVHNFYIVNSDELMRLKHLLVFSGPPVF